MGVGKGPRGPLRCRCRTAHSHHIAQHSAAAEHAQLVESFPAACGHPTGMQQSASTDSAKFLIRVRCPVTPAFHTLPCAHRAFVHRARRLRACQPRCAACGAAAARLRIDADAAGDLEVHGSLTRRSRSRFDLLRWTRRGRSSLRPRAPRGRACSGRCGSEISFWSMSLSQPRAAPWSASKGCSVGHFDDAPRFRVTARVILYAD